MATYTRPNLGGSFEQGDDAAAVSRPNLAGSWEQAAAAAGGAPTITALSARLITATSAQPRISYS